MQGRVASEHVAVEVLYEGFKSGKNHRHTRQQQAAAPLTHQSSVQQSPASTVSQEFHSPIVSLLSPVTNFFRSTSLRDSPSTSIVTKSEQLSETAASVGGTTTAIPLSPTSLAIEQFRQEGKRLRLHQSTTSAGGGGGGAFTDGIADLTRVRAFHSIFSR